MLVLPVTLITALLSDRYQARGVLVAIVSMIAVAGYALHLGKSSLSK